MCVEDLYVLTLNPNDLAWHVVMLPRLVRWHLACNSTRVSRPERTDKPTTQPRQEVSLTHGFEASLFVPRAR
jgi:hypothetical protein